MKKIKPEVEGYKRVFISGNLGGVLMSKELMISASKRKRSEQSIHDNGKQKFRPVYKKDVS